MTKVNKILHKILIAFAIAFIIIIAAAKYLPFESENAVNVFNSTIRLHIKANSDSSPDQALKLAVRNDILTMFSHICENSKSFDEAKRWVENNIETIRLAAENSVKKHGYNYKVSALFGKEKYPVRRYENFLFPAGEYTSLRINIGEHKGNNWWCVLYPPLCVDVATGDVLADRQTFLNYGLSELLPDNPDKCDDKPQIKFALLEFLKKLFD